MLDPFTFGGSLLIIYVVVFLKCYRTRSAARNSTTDVMTSSCCVMWMVAVQKQPWLHVADGQGYILPVADRGWQRGWGEKEVTGVRLWEAGHTSSVPAGGQPKHTEVVRVCKTPLLNLLISEWNLHKIAHCLWIWIRSVSQTTRKFIYDSILFP